jgi:hypothetical protein
MARRWRRYVVLVAGLLCWLPTAAQAQPAATGCSGQQVLSPGFELGALGQTQTVTEQVSIPAGCHGTLSFWLHIETEETTTTIAYDKLTLKAGTTTLATWSNLNHNTGYIQQNLMLPAGSFALTYTATEDATLLTSFFVNQVTLTLS